MQFHSALSSDPDLRRACRDAVARARAGLDGAAADLCMVFASPGYGDLDAVPGLLMDHVGARALLGCSGGGVIGAGVEIEGQPAVSVTLGSLPGVDLHVRHLVDGDLPDADAPPGAWTEMCGLPAGEAKALLLLPEPFTFPAERLLEGLDYAYPGTPKVGGLASGGGRPGQNSLFIDTSRRSAGALVLGLGGAIEMDTMVAQGCKPLGKVGSITACENHYLIAVDGQPALAFLQEQIKSLGDDDLQLARRAPMFLGIAMDPFAERAPGPGDFLIRNILDLDRSTGMLAIGQVLSVGRRVQFHLRDRRSSDQDLRQVLGRGARTTLSPQGALLFSCLGRGEHLYGEAGHDSRVFKECVGDVPLGGFFCNGEIGPVSGSTYLHGYTSSFGVFREAGG